MYFSKRGQVFDKLHNASFAKAIMPVLNKKFRHLYYKIINCVIVGMAGDMSKLGNYGIN